MSNPSFRLIHIDEDVSGNVNYPLDMTLEDILTIIRNRLNIVDNWRICRSINLNQGVNAGHFYNLVENHKVPPMDAFLKTTLIPIKRK